MKLRNPLIALGILAGLSTYVYIVEMKGGEKKRREKEASERVLPVEAGDVAGFTLIRGGERVRLEKVKEKWRIQEPQPADPDVDAVDRLVGSLVDLRISHDLGKQADPGSYNLTDPPLRLEVQVGAGKPPGPLSLGDEAPTGGGTYARLGDSNRILVVSGASALQGATFFSLRDKAFLKFDPSRLSACRILRGKDEIDLRREAGKWRIAAPVRAPADDPSVADLLFALERLTVMEFVEERPSASSLQAWGLNPPRTRVILTGEEWKGEKDLAFGSAGSGSLYALHPAGGALVKVSDSIEAKLKSGAAELRKKEILPFSRFEVSRLRITGAGAGPLELERKDDREWKRVSPTPGAVGKDSVDLLLRNLAELKADAFVDEPVKDPGRYGLVPPSVRLDFWKKGQPAEAPAGVEIGRADAAGRVPMRVAPWQALMLVPFDSWSQALEQARKVAVEQAAAEASPAQTAPAKAPAPAGASSPKN